jgi:hypothetical protein
MEKGSIRVPLFTAQTAAQTSIPVDVRSYQELTVYLTSIGTTSSGAVTIEEADWDPYDSAQVYSGTWSAIGSAVSASTFTGGAQLAVHLPAPSAYGWLRVRISTLIGGGGSISVALRAG